MKKKKNFEQAKKEAMLHLTGESRGVIGPSEVTLAFPRKKKASNWENHGRGTHGARKGPMLHVGNPGQYHRGRTTRRGEPGKKNRHKKRRSKEGPSRRDLPQLEKGRGAKRKS